MIQRQAPGRIITVISDASRWGDAGLEIYAGAKAGAAGFMRSVARSLGRHGITAKSVAIALTATPAVERTLKGDPERLKRTLEKYIIRRPGRPDDMVRGRCVHVARKLAVSRRAREVGAKRLAAADAGFVAPLGLGPDCDEISADGRPAKAARPAEAGDDAAPAGRVAEPSDGDESAFAAEEAAAAAGGADGGGQW